MQTNMWLTPHLRLPTHAPNDASNIHPHRRPTGALECADERSVVHLAVFAHRYRWGLTGRRVALYDDAATICDTPIAHFLAFPQHYTRNSSLGVHSSIPQAHPVADLLAHAAHAESGQDPIRRNRATHGLA